MRITSLLASNLSFEASRAIMIRLFGKWLYDWSQTFFSKDLIAMVDSFRNCRHDKV